MNQYSKKLTQLSNKYSDLILRLSLFIIFFWFGFLKLIDMSPAKDLVEATVYWWPIEIFFPILGVWECLIGLLFLHKKTTLIAFVLMIAQMGGTFFPFIIVPEQTWVAAPFAFTLAGQYVVKNIALIACAVAVVGSLDKK